MVTGTRAELAASLVVSAVLLLLVYMWPRVGRAKWWTAVSLALIVGLSLAHQGIFRTLADDAFITFRYALNCATGNGIVFNPGERVEGYSSFLFLVLLAALKRFGDADIVTAARVLGVAASVATIFVTYRLARSLTNGDRHAGLVAALLVAASGTFAVWGPSGMETTIFALVVTLAALAVTSERWLWAGLLIALATMTRPDGILFVLLVGFYAFFGQPTMRQRLSTALRVSIPMVSVLVPWTLWRVHYYGYLIPNAVKAKEGMDPAYQAGLGIVYVLKFIGANWPVVALAGGVGAYSRWHGTSDERGQVQPKSARPLGLFLLAYLVYVILVGGDWMPAWRFLAPLVPLAAVLIAGLCARAPGFQVAKRSAASLVAVACGLLFATSFVDSNLLPAVKKWNAEVAGATEIGQWFRRTLPQRTLVAGFANGALSYYSQLPDLDMLGLTDEHIARSGLRRREGIPGHVAYDYVYVAERKPAIVAFLGTRQSQGFEAAPGPGYIADPLKPFYEPLSFWFPGSTNPLGQYANILVLKSESTQIATWLAADPRVKRVAPQASFFPFSGRQLVF